MTELRTFERQRLVELAAENNPGREREVRVMAQTIAEAYVNEGRTEGRTEKAHRRCAEGAQEMRAVIRSFLETRFGPLPETLLQRIAATTDLAKLGEAIRLAAFVQKLDDFHV